LTYSALYGTGRYGESYYGVIQQEINSDSYILSLGYLGPSQPEITDVKYAYTKPLLRKSQNTYTKPLLRKDNNAYTKPKIRTTYKKNPYIVDSY